MKQCLFLSILLVLGFSTTGFVNVSMAGGLWGTPYENQDIQKTSEAKPEAKPEVKRYSQNSSRQNSSTDKMGYMNSNMEKLYVGINLFDASLENRINNMPLKADGRSIGILAGYKFNALANIQLDYQYTKLLQDGVTPPPFRNLEMHLIGVTLNLKQPIGFIDPFFGVGFGQRYVRGDMVNTTTALRADVRGNDTGLIIKAGFSLFVNENLNIQAVYTRFKNELETVSFGPIWNF